MIALNIIAISSHIYHTGDQYYNGHRQHSSLCASCQCYQAYSIHLYEGVTDNFGYILEVNYQGAGSNY